MKALGWFSLALIAVAFFALFVVQSLVAMNRPRDRAELRAAATIGMPVPTAAESAAIPRVENFEARDRSLLGFRHYRSKEQTRLKLYLVHAETWDDLQFTALATGLAYRAGTADVFTFDLRGHGQNPLHRGDVDYVGQPTDDLADLIRATSAPGDVIVIGGHSAGAAVAARLAVAPGRIKLNGLLLLAPILSPDFSANRPALGGWALPLKARVAALELQNALGFHWSDREIAVQYAIPEAVWEGPLGYSVTSDYTWRFVQSMQLPSNNGAEFARIRAPYLAVVGSDDEVIDAAKLEPAMKTLNKHGEYAVLAQETHFSLVNSQQTLAIIQNWLSKIR
ncbi:alpha/beta hydrolase [Rhizobium sp. C4]|uniref:alpha/beta hydrolase n=1 Tax=Rhizobium sp. C4 TaxID=1349800 RepID=UPI001E36EB72|nr:alpha/beta fold hydrolase [Rhizobium sp. C4]MCD2172001.1 alpha/beta hydrolase [Rhizobium sp. C4]